MIIAEHFRQFCRKLWVLRCANDASQYCWCGDSLIRHLRTLKKLSFQVHGEFWRAARSASARSAIIYTTSLCLSLGVPFLLLPILTRYIAPHGYGTLTILQAIITLTAAVSLFGLRNPILRVFSTRPEDDNADFLASSLALMALLFAGCLLIASAIKYQISELTGVSWKWTILAMTAGFAAALGQIQFTLLQAAHKSMQYAATQVFFSLFAALLSLLLVVELKFFWVGRAISVCIAAMLAGTWALLYFWRRGLLGRVNAKDFLEALSFGAAIAPYSLSMLALPYIDRFVLRSQFSLVEVGIYALAAHLAQGYLSLSGAFNLAVTPWIFRRLKSLTSAREVHYFCIQSLMISLFLALGGAVFYVGLTIAVPILFPAHYQPALNYFPWLLAGATCQSLIPIFNALLVFHEKKTAMGVIGVGGLFFSVAFVLTCVAFFGPIGAAIGMFSSRLFLLAANVAAASWLVLRN